jgi:hypothetical protein
LSSPQNRCHQNEQQLNVDSNHTLACFNLTKLISFVVCIYQYFLKDKNQFKKRIKVHIMYVEVKLLSLE